MELALFIYLAGIVGNIKVFAIISCAATAVVLILISLNYGMEYPRPKESLWSVAKYLIIATCCSGLFAALIPSEKTMYMMAGGYATQSVITSETANKTVKLINEYLDSEFEKISKKK